MVKGNTGDAEQTYRELAVETNTALSDLVNVVYPLRDQVREIHHLVCGNGSPGLCEQQRITDAHLVSVKAQIRAAVAAGLSVLGAAGVFAAGIVWQLITNDIQLVRGVATAITVIVTATPHP